MKASIIYISANACMIWHILNFFFWMQRTVELSGEHDGLVINSLGNDIQLSQMSTQLSYRRLLNWIYTEQPKKGIIQIAAYSDVCDNGAKSVCVPPNVLLYPCPTHCILWYAIHGRPVGCRKSSLCMTLMFKTSISLLGIRLTHVCSITSQTLWPR